MKEKFGMKHFAWLVVAIAVLNNLSLSANSPIDPVLEPCLVKAKNEVEIPAQKEGMLIELNVLEGSVVKEGERIAVIDDREAKAQVMVSEYALDAAKQKAVDTIEERFAAKSAEVAKVDLERDLEANRRQPGAVPEIEISQKQLMLEKSTLQIEKAQKDRVIAELDAKTKEAELGAAKVALEKRSIYAPFSGEVVKLQREKSEWVNPGDPILTLMRFDVLYAEARAPVSLFDREDLLGKNVTVTVPRARGKEVSLPGKVVHVSQMVESGGTLTVRAEVQNVKEGTSWAIQPSISPRAKMTIHLNK
jgi:multidrug efflux pump subunit AcrA (membrane-fusion protein)